MISFLGTSHAAWHLCEAVKAKGFVLCDLPEARLVFVSEDTPTDETGKRDLEPIRNLVLAAAKGSSAPIILTSQVAPGFTRNLRLPSVIHMTETLRMKDAMQRARFPEQFIVGVPDPQEYVLPRDFMTYLYAPGDARVHIVSYEEAEFAKIAINMMLAAQVDATNRLSEAAVKVGANWGRVAEVLRCDSRIGPDAYLTPGRWHDSRHLLRDHVTLEAILAR